MKLRQRILQFLIISIALFAVGTVSMLRTSYVINRWYEARVLSTEFHTGVSNLTILAFDYAANRSQRAAEQWNIGYASLRSLAVELGAYEMVEPLLEQSGLATSTARLDEQFRQLIVFFEQSASQSAALFFSERERIIITLFLNSAQSLTADADLFQQQISTISHEAKGTSLLIMTIIFVFILSFNFVLYLLFQFQFLLPITKLAQKIEQIDQHFIPLHEYQTRNDEIGILASTIAHMYQRLSEIISAQKKKEKQLQEISKKLATSNKDLEQFAYIASHDLQEPLRKVKNFTDLFLSKYADSSDEKAKTYQFYIHDGVDRMQQLIQDLLMFSRSAKQNLEIEPCSVNSLVQMALNTLEIPEHAVIHVDELPEIVAPRQLTAQLFQNLIGNALKYQKDGVAPEVKVSYSERADDFLFRIADNGIGMEEQYLKNIFKAFFRLHSRDEYSGTGIGLAICMRIVNRYGGDIWAESELGKGSTFCFTWPKQIAQGEGN